MDFDLNINNYETNDLLKLLNISPNYTLDIVENKVRNYCETIKNDRTISINSKKDILYFFNDVKIKLLQTIELPDNDYNHQRKNAKNSANLINNNTITKNISTNNIFSDTKIDYDITEEENNEDTTNHPIVNKPFTNFIYSNPSMAFDGIINPLERRVITKVISLDSRFRENYCSTNSNNFPIELNSPLQNVISMKLVALELPRMWYSISNAFGNNVMEIELYNMKDYANNTQKIIIPNGNYSNETLVMMLNNYFTNVKNGLEYIRFDVNIANSKAYFYVKSDPTVDTILPYDPANAHYSPNFYYRLNFSNKCSGFGLYLGYKNAIYDGTKDSIFQDNFFVVPGVIYRGIIISEISCGTNLDYYIFVDVNDFNKNFTTNTIVSQKTNSFLGNNILGRITLNILPDGILINNPSDYNFKTRDYYGPVKIRKLQIRLIDRFGREIDLLNNDFSISLEFNVLYS